MEVKLQRFLLKMSLVSAVLITLYDSATCANFDSESLNPRRWTNRLADPTLRPTLNSRRVMYQDKLLSLAEDFTKKSYVPYIWGGGTIGEEKHCYACRACVKQRKPSLKNRLNECEPCRYCGIDCSHFVYRLFKDAGLEYGYATSRELSTQTTRGLLMHYNLVDIGRDLTVAQPGDLLVYPRHISMLTKVLSESHGDMVHASRFRGDNLHLGGVRWDRNINIVKYRGNLIRILRHKDFFVNARDFLGINQVRWNLMPQLLWTGINP